MPRFSANLSTLFREYAPLDRIRAAREAGFDTIEIQFPYDLDLGALAGALGEHRMAVSLINVPAGDLAGGGEGTACLRERIAEFREGTDAALRYAEAIGAANVNVLAGRPAPERDRRECLSVFADNLAWTAERFAAIGVGVVVEAINDRDRPNFLLPRAADVTALLDRIGHPNAALQFDVYHSAMMDEDPAGTFQRHVARIGHVQFADAPGRQEPGTGTVDFPGMFAAIDASAYRGWVAAEYSPSGRTEDSLAWMAATA